MRKGRQYSDAVRLFVNIRHVIGFDTRQTQAFLLRFGIGQPLWLALLVSSGLFALGHLTPEMSPLQMVGVGVPIFISGSVFAATYRLTGSLLPGMLAHVLNDQPTAVGLALGPGAKGSVGAVVVTVSVFAWLLLGSSAARYYPRRAPTAYNGLERLSAAIQTHLFHARTARRGRDPALSAPGADHRRLARRRRAPAA